MTAGQTIILRGARTIAHRLVDSAPEGAVMNIREAKRTNEQNDKFWAMVGDISRAKPEGRIHPPDVWKALLMSEAGFKPLFEPSLDGQGVIPVGYKSSRLTKAEFSDLIEAAYAYGARHEVEWSEPALTKEGKEQ
jgi:hypothetical protein